MQKKPTHFGLLLFILFSGLVLFVCVRADLGTKKYECEIIEVKKEYTEQHQKPSTIKRKYKHGYVKRKKPIVITYYQKADVKFIDKDIIEEITIMQSSESDLPEVGDKVKLIKSDDNVYSKSDNLYILYIAFGISFLIYIYMNVSEYVRK